MQQLIPKLREKRKILMHTVDKRQRVFAKRSNLLRNTDNQHDNRHDCKREIIAPVILQVLLKVFLLLKHDQLTEHIVEYKYDDLYNHLRHKLLHAKCIAQDGKSKYLNDHRHQTCTDKLHRLDECRIKSLLLALEHKKFICKVCKSNSHSDCYGIACVS